jgi:hypothetical protein
MGIDHYNTLPTAHVVRPEGANVHLLAVHEFSIIEIQIVLFVTEKAASEDIRMKGFVQKDCLLDILWVSTRHWLLLQMSFQCQPLSTSFSTAESQCIAP